MNWAVVGTGNIVKKFILGLSHVENAKLKTVVSRSAKKAQIFSEEYAIENYTSSFDSVLSDPSIDIIYIGTPHTSHAEYAIRALEKGKAVLCEKPMTVNREEAERVINASRENNTFFMEAMWTRFLPAIRKVKEWLDDKLIGDVKMVESSFGDLAPFDPEWRLFNKELAGGALLDIGIYPLSFSQMVYSSFPERIVSSMFLGQSGVDEMTNIILDYPNGSAAVLSTAINCNLETSCRIFGTKGKIEIPDFVYARKAILTVYNQYEEISSPDFISNGYNYEAEEVMRCVEKGLIESPLMKHEESLDILSIMDTIRHQNGLVYPCEE